MADLSIGDLLDARYRIDYPIARGGMSTVFRCVDLRLGRAVAAKVMDQRLAADPIFLQRFSREARSMAQLSHPHLVGVYDFSAGGNTNAQGEPSPVFLIMELITGGTLRELLAERQLLNPETAVEIMRGVLSGLAVAHRAGLIHRDIKPDNVLITADGTVKLSDFGLVRSLNSGALGTEQIVGTPAYISPEQVRQQAISPETDVYSAGILLFELLTGEVPFQSDTPLAQARQRLYQDVPAPSQYVSDIPPLLDALVASATARNPEERFRDAEEFLSALDDVARELHLPSTVVPVPDDAAARRAARVEADTSMLPRVMDATSILDSTDVLAPGAPTAQVPAPTGTETMFQADYADYAEDVAPMGAAAPSALPSATAPPNPAVPRQPTAEPAVPAPPAPLSNRSGWRFALWWIFAVLVVGAVAIGGWWFGSGRYGEIPQVIGMDRINAVSVVQNAGFTATTREVYSDDVPQNSIVGTDPDSTQKAVRGSTVAVLVSLGRPRVPVIPKDSTVSAYQALLQQRELGSTLAEAVYSDDVPEGKVAETTPPAGTELRTGSTVELHPSKGPAPVEVPAVEGLSLEQATKVLRGAGLEIGEVQQVFNAGTEAGHVFETIPLEGEEVKRGEKINLRVSNALRVPDVTGLSLTEATQKLADAGLTTSRHSHHRAMGATAKRADQVAETRPAAGSLVDPANPEVELLLPGKVEVPRVVGKRYSDATKTLRDAGFRVVLDSDKENYRPKDSSRVYYQSPMGGKTTTPGSEVSLQMLG